MITSKTVRLQDATLEKLGKMAKPFESPNDCIERILSGRSCTTEAKKNEEFEQKTETDE